MACEKNMIKDADSTTVMLAEMELYFKEKYEPIAKQYLEKARLLDNELKEQKRQYYALSDKLRQTTDRQQQDAIWKEKDAVLERTLEIREELDALLAAFDKAVDELKAQVMEEAKGKWKEANQ